MRLSFRIVLLVLAALTLAACDAWNSEVSLNRKMTVEVETPYGLKTGSSVVRIWAKKLSKSQSFLSGGNAGAVSVRGEAVVVELGDGKYLFVSNGRDAGAFYRLKRAWGIEKSSAGKFADYLRNIKKTGGSVVLDLNQYPTLFSFEHLNDSSSVKVLYHTTLADFFGSGYEIRSISYEITDESITNGTIENLLEWYFTAGGLIPWEKKKKLHVSDPNRKIKAQFVNCMQGPRF